MKDFDFSQLETILDVKLGTPMFKAGIQSGDIIVEIETEKKPKEIAVGIINVALTFLAIIAIVIILLGGFKWMTSAGNEDKVGEAKRLLVSGIIGLIIIIAAYSLTNFLIRSVIDSVL